MYSFGYGMYSFCELVGIVDHVTQGIKLGLVGLTVASPTTAITGVISAMITKFTFDKISESVALKEIAMFSNFFCKVTSNLNNSYNEATFALLDVYRTGNQEKLNEALMDLITGEGRTRDGTLDRVFNKE